MFTALAIDNSTAESLSVLEGEKVNARTRVGVGVFLYGLNEPLRPVGVRKGDAAGE